MWDWGGDLTTPDYNFEVMTCSNTSADAQWCNPEFSKLTADALHEKNFQKRVDMLHEAEKLELEASPYVVYAYTPYISVTRTDTWTGYTPSPQPGGQPFGMNWLQLQLIVPGDEISSNYAGTGYVITFMVVITLLVVGVSRWQRWREEREPFERGTEAAEPSQPGAGAAVRFVLSKCTVALGTLMFVLVFNFFLFRIAGDPIKDLIRGNPHLTEQGRERLIKQRGLRDSYITQFRIYVDEVAHGDLGTSFQTNQPVSTMIWAALPNTLILVGSSTILAVIIGTWLGIYAAGNRGSPGDTGVVQGSLFFYAMPDFWAGMILIWLFAVVLGLFPTGLKSEPGASFSDAGYAWNVAQHAMLPIITLTIGIVGQWVVIMRSALADTLREDFVTTARAIGLPRHRVMAHATRNAILPVVALSAINLGFIVAGATVVETLFSWPGMGLLTYNAILNQDYPLLQGVFLVTSAAVIAANLLADLAYVYLDPRVRME